MPSIPDTLRTTAARCPDREALVFRARRRGQGRAELIPRQKPDWPERTLRTALARRRLFSVSGAP